MTGSELVGNSHYVACVKSTGRHANCDHCQVLQDKIRRSPKEFPELCFFGKPIHAEAVGAVVELLRMRRQHPNDRGD